MQDHPSFQLASGIWAAAAEGDADALRDLLAEDVVWWVGGQHALSGEYVGPDAVLDYLASVGERAGDLRSELTDIYVNDDGAVVAYHVTARRELKRMEMDYLLEIRIRGGRIASARTVACDQAATNAFWG